MSHIEGPGPGQPGNWREGTVPPGARALLTSLDVDPDDVSAVRAFYEAREPADRPYWYERWSQANPPAEDE